jgi:hypothetical protein
MQIVTFGFKIIIWILNDENSSHNCFTPDAMFLIWTTISEGARIQGKY